MWVSDVGKPVSITIIDPTAETTAATQNDEEHNDDQNDQDCSSDQRPNDDT